MSVHVNPYPNANIIQMVTTTRDDLLAISRILARAIDPQFLFDKDHPLSVSINGSLNAGKSIIPFEMRNTLFQDAENQQMRGNAGHDEFHEASLSGNTVQINVIDPLWGHDYGHPAFKPLEEYKNLRNTEIEDTFKSIRTEGGIDFYQNKSHHRDVDLAVWVEVFGSQGSNNGECPRVRASPLYSAFKEAFIDSPIWKQDWVRYVEVLALGPAFNEAVKRLQSLENKEDAPNPEGKPTLVKRTLNNFKGLLARL